MDIYYIDLLVCRLMQYYNSDFGEYRTLKSMYVFDHWTYKEHQMQC